MNLLVIIHEYPPLCGGGGVHAFGMVRELSKRHSVTVITPRTRRIPPPDEISGTIHAVPVFGRVNAETQSRFSAYLGFASFIISATVAALFLSFRKRYDFIHSYFAVPSGIPGMIVGTLRNVPHCVTLIEADLFDPGSNCTRAYGGILRRLIRQVINSAALRTAISGYIADAARRHYAISRTISIIPPGIPATGPFQRPATPPAKKVPEVTIIATGRLVERKDYPTLLTAFSMMKFRQCRLVIIGCGPLLEKLQHHAAQLQITNRVLFTGFISVAEKLRYLMSADIFALTSVHEGFGIVIAEAMNCGLPVVSTDSGGQKDLVVHEENGFLAPAGDTARIAKYLDTAASDKSLRRRMGAASLARVPQFYNHTVAMQYSALMESRRHQ